MGQPTHSQPVVSTFSGRDFYSCDTSPLQLTYQREMESGLKVLAPTAVPKPKNPWGAPKDLTPCSLASVIDEELARKLAQEGNEKNESRYLCTDIRRGYTHTHT